jgi:hypothetical protein
MAESTKDLSTTALGLIAAYFLPGAIVLGALSLRWPRIGDFLLGNTEHFAVALALSLIIGLLLNGLRLALLSRWLFREMSYRETDFEGIEPGRFSELQAAIDEVFRLHQFYSALYFLLLPIGLVWLFSYAPKEGSGWPTPQTPWYEWRLPGVVLLLIAWRVLARAALEAYEFYHQIAMGILRKPLPAGPHKGKGRLVAVLFNWGYLKRYTEYIDDLLPPSGKVGDTVVLVGEGFTSADTISFGAAPAAAPLCQSDKYLTAIVPNDATTGSVRVTRPAPLHVPLLLGYSLEGPVQARTLNSRTEFRVTPQVTGFNPTQGAAGTRVAITGLSLTQTTRVTFGGVLATGTHVDSNTQVTAFVPDHAVTGPIAVTTPGGSATSANNFTVT